MAARLIGMAAQGARRALKRGLLEDQLFSRAYATEALSAYASDAVAVKGHDERFLKYNSPKPRDFDYRSILARPETRYTVLPSGLRIASEYVPNSETATVGVWIDSGSRFETDENNGTAHFLEHLTFKGTAKRSLRQLEEEVENMGGHLNAYTAREQTSYFAKVLKKNVPDSIDILSDILQHSKLDEASIERERGVILREMEEVEKQTEEVLFDHLHATAYQYSPLGRTILGPSQNIRSLTKADLHDYIATHYTAPRMVVAAAGAINHDQLVKEVEKQFNKLSNNPMTAAELVRRDPSKFTGSEVRIRDDDFPMCHFAIAVEGASWSDADAIPLMVMQSLLGSWNKNVNAGKHSGSGLAQLVAANDLCESVMAFNTHYSDTGLFGIHAVAEGDKVDDLAWVIMHEFTKLVYRVEEDDVIRAKNQLKSSMLLHMDGTGPTAEDIGRQLLTYGRRMPLEETFARIDAVDAATVKRVADRFIYDKEIAIAAMGRTQNLPDYTWFRRRTYWLRY